MIMMMKDENDDSNKSGTIMKDDYSKSGYLFDVLGEPWRLQH